MEVKINREIRNYSEIIYFGLTIRQFIFSVLSCLVAVFLFFSFRSKVNTEILSWICIIGSAPFAALGFVNYNGMTAEKLFIAWLKSEILVPRKLKYESRNLYYDILKSANVTKRGKEKNNDKNN